jgi:hypothetical protein
MLMSNADKRAAMRESQIDCIKTFIRKNVDAAIQDPELASLDRLSNQTLHLLAAAIDSL